MKIESHAVIVYTINPDTDERQVVEVANLLAVPATFYEEREDSSEVDPVSGYITLIGGRTYRLHIIPGERVVEKAKEMAPVLEVIVPWDQIEWNPKPPESKL